MTAKIIFGKRWEDDNAIVFAHWNRLPLMAEIHKAIRESSNWGEFRSRVPAEVYREAVERSGDYCEPKDSDVLEIGAYDDGDWPGFLEQEMLEWMPMEAQRMGIVKPTVLNGDFLYLAKDNLIEILEILRSHGYECIHSDSKIREAMDLASG